MTYEREYLPAEPEDDKVFVLKGGRAEEVDVPDDEEPPTDEEGAPEGATSSSNLKRSGNMPGVAATRQKAVGQPTEEE